jgi:hypothetical protein
MQPGSAPIAATEVVRRPSAWPRLFGWVAASIPATGIATAVVLFMYAQLFGGGGGSLMSPMARDPLFDLAIGVGLGMMWAAILALPHLAMLWIWVTLSRAFGDTDLSRGRILIGMIVWSFPQALVAGAIESWPAFAAAWLVVSLGLWSPRAIIRGLRPGVFG